jgi:hypothetical protein
VLRPRAAGAWRFVACLATLAFLSNVRAADAVAFVADIKGEATVEGAGKLSFLAELVPGTKVILGKDALAVVTYAANGAEFTLRGPGEFVVSGTDVKALKGAAPTRRTVVALANPAIVTRVSQTATASLRMRGVPLTPSAAKAGLEYPIDAQVATQQPILRWRGEPGPEGFAVVVRDANGKEVWKGTLRTTSVRPAGRLAPAARYSWSVSGSGPIGEAHFETLPTEAIARAEKSRFAIRSFSDRVLHAFLLQELGATQDARQVWAELARERHDLPELAVLAK